MKPVRPILFAALLSLLFCFLLAGCGSGPADAVKGLSKALENKDIEQFKTHVDIHRLARSMAEAAQAEQEKMFSQAGSIFGSDTSFFDGLLPKATDPKMIKTMANEMTEGVGNGQLIAISKQKGLPFDPEALKKIQLVEEKDKNCAVYGVDAENGIRSFFSIRKGDDANWKITGLFDKKSQAAYWCSDQRIADITRENEKRIAKANEHNAKSKERWDKKVADYEVALAAYKKRKAFCDAEEKTLVEKQAAKFNNVKFTVESTKKIQQKPYRYATLRDYIQFQALIKNNNDKPIKVERISMTFAEKETDIKTKEMTFYDRDDAIIEPGQTMRKEFTFSLTDQSYIAQEHQRILDGTLNVSFGADTIRMNNDRMSRNDRISDNERSPQCSGYISKPSEPMIRLKEVKPQLLEI